MPVPFSCRRETRARNSKGKNRVAHAFRLAAFALSKDKGYLGAYLRRQKSRLGAPKAITATAHKLARIVYNMMRHGAEYAKRSEAEYAAEHRTRLEKNLKRRARELGFELVKPDGEVLAAALPPDLLLDA